MTEPTGSGPKRGAGFKQARPAEPSATTPRPASRGKLFVRERLARLLDGADGFVEDGLLHNVLAGDLPADGSRSPASAPSAGARWR